MADQGSDDVTSTLNDLEQKLRALESDLQSAVSQPAVPPAPVQPVPVAEEPIAPPSIYEPLPPMPPVEPRPERIVPSPPRPLTEGDPEQIVSEARRRITDLRAELDELARTREEIAQTANELVSDYNRVLSEPPVPVESPEPVEPPAPQAEMPPPPPEPEPLAPLPLLPEQTIQQGPVAIDAGFFRDLTSLSAFEQSIARVPGVVGVHVREFSQGRALIDAQLSHPIPLGAELQRHAPLRFTVTDAGPQHLMLAIAG